MEKVAKEILMILKSRYHWMQVVSQLPKGSWIEWDASVWGYKNIFIGSESIVCNNAIVSTCYSSIHNIKKTKGYVKIGSGCTINPYAQIHSWGGYVEIGNNCSLNSYSIIYGTGGVKIGNGVRIAASTTIVASMHRFDSTDVPIHKQGYSAKGIIIEDDIWIGSGVTILDGVTVREGSIVGAGAVVTEDVPSYSIVAGVPARIIKKRK